MKQLSSILLPVLVLFAQALIADTVYKGTDANGHTLFSDQPFPNSEKITITPPPPTSQNHSHKQLESTKANPPLPEVIDYKISIVEPTDQQTFTNDITSIEVKISVTPKLAANDRIHLEINGEPFGEYSQATNFVLNQFPRGTYRIQAIITSADFLKVPIAKSQTVTIFQQRAIAKRDVTNLAPQGKMAPQAP